LDLYLTLSRGALGALAVGLLVLVALVPTRAMLLSALLVVAGTTVPAALAATVLDGVMRADATGGGAMLAVLVVAGAACALAATRLGGGPLPLVRPLAVVAIVTALAVTVVALRSGTPTTGSGRLVSVESYRYDYWGVALEALTARGTGTGGFRVEWLLRRAS